MFLHMNQYLSCKILQKNGLKSNEFLDSSVDHNLTFSHLVHIIQHPSQGKLNIKIMVIGHLMVIIIFHVLQYQVSQHKPLSIMFKPHIYMFIQGPNLMIFLKIIIIIIIII